MRKIFLSLLLISTMGCATTYDGGTVSQRITENTHRISMRGNEFTDENKAKDFALLKAAEATIDSGKRYFVITETQDKTEVSEYVTPESVSSTTYGTSTSTSDTNMNASLFGIVLPNSLEAKANGTFNKTTDTDEQYLSRTNTTIVPSKTYTSIMPGVDLTIETYEQQPNGEYLDAYEITRYLGPTINPERWAPETIDK